MATEKITKAMVLDMILACESCAANADIVAYCENEKALLAKKAVKAKERAVAKKEKGNDLRDCIEAILKDASEPMTREMVLGCIADEEGELTVAKVGAQISQLVQLDRVHKTTVKSDEGKSKVAYVYGPAETDAE